MEQLSYILKRSSRKTISITLNYDNTVTVRCNYKTPIANVEKFLEEKKDWIRKHINKNEQRNGELSPVINLNAVLVKGEILPLEYGSRNLICSDCVYITSVKSLKKLYVDNFGEEFLDCFNQIARDNGFKFYKVGFRDYKSRWGCCNARGEITFNYKILMLSERLWRYVIVHELCHTVHMNHSPAFYSLVGSVMPDYRLAIRELKRYSPVSSLY